MPVVPRDFGDGLFDIGGELEFEEESGAFAFTLFVPGHDGFLAKADVTAVETDVVLGNRAAPDFFHRIDPAARTHRVAFAPFHVQAQPRAANHAGEWMMAGATGLLRVVADGGVLLFAVSWDHGGIPVGHAIGRYGVIDHLLGGSKPPLDLRGVELFAETAESILTAQAALMHAGDFGHRRIILHPAAMGETGATNQAVKRESFEDVGYGSGVRACARHRVVCSKPGKYPASPQEVIPCHQSTIRRERLVAAAQVKLTAVRKEFEIQFSFTQWVNQ